LNFDGFIFPPPGHLIGRRHRRIATSTSWVQTSVSVQQLARWQSLAASVRVGGSNDLIHASPAAVVNVLSLTRPQQMEWTRPHRKITQRPRVELWHLLSESSTSHHPECVVDVDVCEWSVEMLLRAAVNRGLVLYYMLLGESYVQETCTRNLYKSTCTNFWV